MHHVSEEPWLRRSVHWVTRSLSLCFLRLFIRGYASVKEKRPHGPAGSTHVGDETQHPLPSWEQRKPAWEKFAIWQQLKRPTIYRWEQLFPPERFMSRCNFFLFFFSLFTRWLSSALDRRAAEAQREFKRTSKFLSTIWFPELSKGRANRIIWYPIYIKKTKKKNRLVKVKVKNT